MGKFYNVISSIIISVSFITGCYLISKNIDPNKSIEKINENKTIFSDSEIAEYLGITAEELNTLIDLDKKKREQFGEGIYDTYTLFPYVELPGGKHLFLISEIENWVRYNSINKMN